MCCAQSAPQSTLKPHTFPQPNSLTYHLHHLPTAVTAGLAPALLLLLTITAAALRCCRRRPCRLRLLHLLLCEHCGSIKIQLVVPFPLFQLTSKSIFLVLKRCLLYLLGGSCFLSLFLRFRPPFLLLGLLYEVYVESIGIGTHSSK